MIETIESVNSVINGFVWGPVMLLLLVGTGILLTIRAGFPQLTKLGTIMKSTVGSLFGEDAHKKDEAGISPYQAVATALASTVGTGNITGVATAIVAGGPGAVFWMWVSRRSNVLYGKWPERKMAGCNLCLLCYTGFFRDWEHDPVQLYRNRVE